MNKVKISFVQFVFMIVGVQFGINTFSAPALLAREAGTDGWMSLILGGIASTIASILAMKVMARQPEKSFYQLLRHYLGAFVGRIAALSFSAYWLLAFSTIFLYTVHIIQAWILPKTPNYSITLLFLISPYMVLRLGLRSLSRYVEVTFYLTIGLGLFLLIPLKGSNIAFLLPMYKDGLLPILHGVKVAMFLFSGFEIAMLLYPHLTEQQKAIKGVILANSITLLLFFVLIIVSYVFYSPDEILDYIWPSLNIFKVMEFPFVERFEILFISYYLIVISSAILPYLFAASHVASEAIYTRSYRVIVMLCLLSFGIVSFFYNPSYYDLELLDSLLQQLSLIFVYALPACLFFYTILIDKVRKHREASH